MMLAKTRHGDFFEVFKASHRQCATVEQVKSVTQEKLTEVASLRQQVELLNAKTAERTKRLKQETQLLKCLEETCVKNITVYKNCIEGFQNMCAEQETFLKCLELPVKQFLASTEKFHHIKQFFKSQSENIIATLGKATEQQQQLQHELTTLEKLKEKLNDEIRHIKVALSEQKVEQQEQLCESLEKLTKQCEELVDDKIKELSQAESNIDNEKSLLENLRQSFQHVKDTKERALLLLIEDADTTKRNCSELEKLKDLAKSEIDKLAEQLSKHQEEQANINSCLRRQQNYMRMITSTLEKCQQLLEDTRRDIKLTTEEEEKIKAECNMLKDAITEKKRQAAEGEDNICNQKNENNDLESIVTELRCKIKNLDTQLDAVKKLERSKQEELSLNKTDVANADRQISEEKQSLFSCLKELMEALKIEENELATDEQSFTSFVETNIGLCNSQLSKSAAEVQELARQWQEMSLEKEKMLSEIEDLEVHIESLSAEKNVIIKHISGLKTSLSDTQKKQSEANLTLERQKMAYLQLEEDLRKRKKEHERLKKLEVQQRKEHAREIEETKASHQQALIELLTTERNKIYEEERKKLEIQRNQMLQKCRDANSANLKQYTQLQDEEEKRFIRAHEELLMIKENRIQELQRQINELSIPKADSCSASTGVAHETKVKGQSPLPKGNFLMATKTDCVGMSPPDLRNENLSTRCNDAPIEMANENSSIRKFFQRLSNKASHSEANPRLVQTNFTSSEKSPFEGTGNPPVALPLPKSVGQANMRVTSEQKSNVASTPLRKLLEGFSAPLHDAARTKKQGNKHAMQYPAKTAKPSNKFKPKKQDEIDLFG